MFNLLDGIKENLTAIALSVAGNMVATAYNCLAIIEKPECSVKPVEIEITEDENKTDNNVDAVMDDVIKIIMTDVIETLNIIIESEIEQIDSIQSLEAIRSMVLKENQKIISISC